MTPVIENQTNIEWKPVIYRSGLYGYDAVKFVCATTCKEIPKKIAA